MYPLGNYTFTKDGGPVVVGGQISVSRNKLLIDNATEGDSGKYSCKAALNETSSRSSPAPLSVTVVGKFFIMSIGTIVRLDKLAGILLICFHSRVTVIITPQSDKFIQK